MQSRYLVSQGNCFGVNWLRVTRVMDGRTETIEYVPAPGSGWQVATADVSTEWYGMSRDQIAALKLRAHRSLVTEMSADRVSAMVDGVTGLRAMLK